MKTNKNSSVYKFFNQNSKSWILNGYNNDGYNYPVAAHRLRLIKKIIKKNFSKKKLNILDIGCGGGQVTMELAKLGHNVIGMDQSENMLKIANNYRDKFNKKTKKLSAFIKGSVGKNKFNKSQFDLCIAMGVIGYLENDKSIFQLSKKILKPKGIFLVSCRNRLFNMQSISFRTINEIKKKKSISLINEIRELYKDIPLKISNDIIKNLKYISKKINFSKTVNIKEKLSPAHKTRSKRKYKPFFEPRQHTPGQIKLSAKKFGFKFESFHGVHPHLIDPNLNELFPPQIFNKLSDCLQPLEDHPVSLAFSSVFISVFQRKN